jgi:hypothetical protein
MLSKLVLARMNNIEEGFREVIKEVKDLRLAGSSRSRSHSRSRPKEIRPLTARDKKKVTEKKDLKKRRPSSAENPWGQDQRNRLLAKESHLSQ